MRLKHKPGYVNHQDERKKKSCFNSWDDFRIPNSPLSVTASWSPLFPTTTPSGCLWRGFVSNKVELFFPPIFPSCFNGRWRSVACPASSLISQGSVLHTQRSLAGHQRQQRASRGSRQRQIGCENVHFMRAGSQLAAAVDETHRRCRLAA